MESMIMGFKNSPRILQRIMNRILGDFIRKGVEVYLDDIVIHAASREDHDKLISMVFSKLQGII